MWESIDIRCTVPECGYFWSDLVKREDRDKEFPCQDCGGTAQRIIGAPLVLQASYHMGHKRGGDYYLLKEASKLKRKEANLGTKDRGDIQSAIKELRRAASNEKSKTP